MLNKENNKVMVSIEGTKGLIEIRRTLINHENLKWLYSHLETNEEVNDVVSYLKTNDVNIEERHYRYVEEMDIVYTIIEGRLLSDGTHCKVDIAEKLLEHVKNHKTLIYNLKSNEYKLYLELKNKYQETYEYSQNQIED